MTSTTPEAWHTAQLRIPFPTEAHALIAKRALSVDRELNASHVTRRIEQEGSIMVVTYEAATVRLLRLATNGFMDNLKLVVRTLHEFAPPSA